MGSDLVPSALELVDGEALRALGAGERTAPALLIGVDGIAEQVDWQCAEVEPAPRARSAWSRPACSTAPRGTRRGGRAAASARRPSSEIAAVMKWGVLPSQLAEVIEQGGAVAQRNGLRRGAGRARGRGHRRRRARGRRRPTPTPWWRALTEWRALVRGRGRPRADRVGAARGEGARARSGTRRGRRSRIMKGIKEQLDPRGILNPGRFVGGI